MISAWNSGGHVWASTRRNGELVQKKLAKAEYAGFVRDEDRERVVANDPYILDVRADFPGWVKLIWSDYETRKLALEGPNSGLIFEGDVSPVRRYMSDHEVRIDPPRRAYIDLETDSRVAPSRAILGESRLLSWALVDEEGHRRVILLEDDFDDAERELWIELWKEMSKYDQIAAWSGDRFDFKVIEERSKRLLRDADVYWENKKRLLFVDQLLCFKRHHMAPDSGDEKTSLKLNDVCQALIGEGKTDFKASKTWEEWEAGGARRQSLGEYNLQDTALLQKLEKATGYLELQQTIAEVTYTFVNTHGLKPMPWVDGYMLKLAHKRKTHLPSKKPPTGDEKQYEGAFVMETKRDGILRNVHVCDFKSLYPTLIRSFNMGHETKGKSGCTAFGTGVTFATDEESMLACAAREFMELRDHYKKRYAADPNDKDAERKSKAYKIANNSIYGVVGSVWSRYYDVEIVESITLGGQRLIHEVNKLAEELGLEPVAGDTDSCFIAGGTVEGFRDFVRRYNEEILPLLLLEQGCNPQQTCIELAYEKAFDRLIVPRKGTGEPAAKRYAGSFLHYGGKAKSKPEIKGFEYIRGDSIAYARRFQKECIDKLLRGEEDPEAFERWVLGHRESFMRGDIAVSDIRLTRGLSRGINEYKVKGPHVRLAEEMEAAGEDVGEGDRISYVIVDESCSPAKIVSADEFDGTFDRTGYWNGRVYPPTMRILAAAFPNRDWARWIAKRPKPVLPGQMGLFG